MTIKKLSVLAVAFVVLLIGNCGVAARTAVVRKPVKVDAGIRKKIFAKVFKTPFIDTHEHLLEEQDRLSGVLGKSFKSNDWSFLFSHYIDSDMLSAGMPKETLAKFVSPEVDPLEKWELLEPYWPAIKNTGYGQSVQITIKELYGIDEVSARTIKKIQAQYVKTIQPGFYKRILCDMANIESCQVNSPMPFNESAMPQLLMQDIGISKFMWLSPRFFGKLSEPTGVKVTSLSDYHKVIDWWFDKYGKYAVAMKSKHAYKRDIDCDRANEKPTPAMEATFKKLLAKKRVAEAELKVLQDHIFWYSAKKANEYNLPVKLHTGYYAGSRYMPLSRLSENPASAADLCNIAPETRFVFMHICYPYYEDMIAVSKYYQNAYVDMCWSWIINPVAAKDFLKKYLVTAPANKILTFGGDYMAVELVLGHATIARQGIALALSELVEEGWLSLDQALAMVDPIMHQNARDLFDLDNKSKLLKTVEWKK